MTHTGVKCDLMDRQQTLGVGMYASTPRGRRHENPAATTWSAEFLLRAGESREFLGSWINSRGQKETSERERGVFIE